MAWLRSLASMGAILLAGCGLAWPAGAEEAGRTLMRYPTLHEDTIVFVAHDNLWSVPRAGGTARRLTSGQGRDLMPRFSPDGRWLAFTGEYEGNRDVYVMPSGGGPVRRLTFTSDVVGEAPLRWGPNNMVVTWTPDSRSVVFLSRREAWNAWFGKLFSVPLDGGLPTALPLDRGGLLSYSPDGKRIAYNRAFRNFRTWKRYQGGLAQNIDLYDLASHQLTHLTDWVGTETSPMWYRDTVYFLADHDASLRANLWAADLATGTFRQVTHFTDGDIDFPSLGSAGSDHAGIVFQQGGRLYVMDLPGEQVHELQVSVPDDGTRTGPRWVDARPQLRDQDLARQTDFALSPNGKRAAFAARGDLFSVPVEHGNTRNLTATSGADEDHPQWSPDGRWLAYTTDRSGAQQVAIRPAEGGAETVLTHFTSGYFYLPRWSPDGERLAFSDQEHRLWVVARAGGEPQFIAQDPWAEIHDYSWAPDGRWLAWSMYAANQRHGLWLCDTAGGKAIRVSDAQADDFSPVFDPAGHHLYFLSNRHENPVFSQTEFNVATLSMQGIYVATLQRGAPSPFAPRSDEGQVDAAAQDGTGSAAGKGPATAGKADGNAAGGRDEPAHWKPGALPPLKIDLDGLMTRVDRVPLAGANIATLDARADRLYYLTQPPRLAGGALPGDKPVLHVYDLGKRKDAIVVQGASEYALSADGAKVLYKLDRNYVVADAKAGGAEPAKPGAEDGPRTLDLSHLRVRIEPRQEWAEMLDNAWRLTRDFFYGKSMNGVDWNAVHARTTALLPLVGSRGDLNFLIGEMIGELGNSHTYVGGGDEMPEPARVPTAFLGADFALDAASRRYRLATIYPGDNTRESYRAPLTAPGLDIHEGDWLLAIDGVELQAPTDPDSLLVGKADGTVRLTLAAAPDGKRRDVVVQPVKSELSLREQAWIDHNRAAVDRLSGGKVAYLYLSDMSELGLDQFVRQFYPQLDRQALLLDERWNGGGFIDQIVLERLRRVLVALRVNREGTTTTWGQQLIQGPKACLINHYSASDGDLFPYYFRQYKLGPLIGTRTWGGVRGIRGYLTLLDGGYITVPEMSIYGADSQWAIENHGVEPDITVDDSPADWLGGHDVQLEAGVRYLMDALKEAPGGLPPPPPPLPPYPPGVGGLPPAH